MKKIFFTVLFTVYSLFASDFGDRAALPVQKVDGDRAYTQSYNFQVGESGYIIRWFDANHAAIVAATVVQKIDGDSAELVFKPYTGLKNSAFPTAELTPKVGDTVLIRSNYNRAVLIAPNQELYQQITDIYKNTIWIHPDIFASELVKNGTNRPNRKDFRNFCNAYAVGVVYFINGTKGELRDCNSFSLLNTDYITGLAPKNERMKPFFSRIGNIDAGWLEFLSSDTGDFYQYYNDLLSGKYVEADEEGSIFDWLPDF